MDMLTSEEHLKLRRSLIKHEGYANYPYADTVGKLTIGVGYNLSDRGISTNWVDNQLNEDILYFYNHLNEFNWFNGLNADRQIALIDMAFMGLKRFMSFTKMIDALEKKDFFEASQEMLDSDWANQVGNRAAVLAKVILTGDYSL